MKLLFLIFHGFDEANGISKKIRYQVEALKSNKVDVSVCWLKEENGYKYRMLDESILENYGQGVLSKIKKRTGLNCIYQYIIKNNIDTLYVRSDHHTTPFLIDFYKKVQKKGVKILLEIPTYPYDQEYKGLSFGYQWVLFLDQFLRKRMAKYIHKIVTFSDDDFIFGRPTIKISNGIDFNSIPLKQLQAVSSNEELHLIAVATIHPWHGFDRIIRGVIEYYKTPQKRQVFLHIVGAGVPTVLDGYHQLVSEHKGLKNYVRFYGPLFGKELDALFNQCQMGIGSLARHRSGITHLRSLKNREYAARGIPFVYSETDDDFEKRNYILKVPADETNISIEDLIRFYDSVQLTPQEIRNSIDPELSWKNQMQNILMNL